MLPPNEYSKQVIANISHKKLEQWIHKSLHPGTKLKVSISSCHLLVILLCTMHEDEGRKDVIDVL
jgi:hypothetical protein